LLGGEPGIGKSTLLLQAAAGIALAGGLVEAVAIGTTAFVSAPMHGRMAASGNPDLLDRLIATNWIRTAAWTSRAVLAVLMLAWCS
jgi:hypothetical protein